MKRRVGSRADGLIEILPSEGPLPEDVVAADHCRGERGNAGLDAQRLQEVREAFEDVVVGAQARAQEQRHGDGERQPCATGDGGSGSCGTIGRLRRSTFIGRDRLRVATTAFCAASVSRNRAPLQHTAQRVVALVAGVLVERLRRIPATDIPRSTAAPTSSDPRP